MLSSYEVTTSNLLECKYYNSYTIQKEVCCGLRRLELGTSEFLDPHVNLDSSDRGHEVILKCYIMNHGHISHSIHQQTYQSMPDSFRNFLIWDYLVTFPLKYKDLHKDALLVVSVWHGAKLLGGCSCYLFRQDGALKQGLQKLQLDTREEWLSSVLREDRDHSLPKLCLKDSLSSNTESNDILFAVESSLEALKVDMARRATKITQDDIGNESNAKSSFNGSNSISTSDSNWLDNLSAARLQESLHGLQNERRQAIYKHGKNIIADSNFGDGSSQDCSFMPDLDSIVTNHYLIIDLPKFPFPVIFEEKYYTMVPPHIPYSRITEFEPFLDKYHDSIYSALQANKINFDLVAQQIPGGALGSIADWDMLLESPVEEQYLRLSKLSRRGQVDPNTKPNQKERDSIVAIVRAPGNNLTLKEKELLFRFRFCLKENKKALPKFLLSVDWTQEEDVQEIPLILESWRAEVVLDVSDSLKLLGKERAFQSRLVRDYALKTLGAAPDEELLQYLLQLVQAIKYEPRDNDGEGLLLVHQREQSTTSATSAKSGHNSVTSQSESFSDGNGIRNTEGEDSITGEKLMNDIPPLATFLIRRALKNPELANFLYWFLKVEAESPDMGVLYGDIIASFIYEMSSNKDSSNVIVKLQALDSYIQQISSCQVKARAERGRKDAKEAKFKELLIEENLHNIPDGVDSIPSPIEPKVGLTGMLPDETKMFSSAIYPARLTFNTDRSCGNTAEDDDENIARDDLTGERLLSEGEISKTRRRIMFKAGDDLRQDQLIMQMMNLFDQLLKKVNLDLKYKTYVILATGPNDGCMDFVDDSAPVSAVLKQHQGSISNYFREHHGMKDGPNGIDPKVMDTFVKSCAASCVFTYILGVGDRHLDNIMLLPDGHMFHIDFGFVFGRDPKPLPPPFRFTKEMAEVLGGTEGEMFQQFKSLACQAYNWLRKSANLILNLLELMVDARIPDLSVYTNPQAALNRVKDRFRLDMSDEAAESFFAGLINDTLYAIAPRIMEVAHQFSVARR